MSMDFDSGALQTQQDDEDEYDREDYAREQELQQLLTDLPHDLLDDSLSSSPEPNYSDCSGHEISEQNQHWEHETSWDSARGITNQQQQLPHYAGNQYSTDYFGKQEHLRNNMVAEKMSNGWPALHSDDERNVFHAKYNYPEMHANDESNVEDFHDNNHYDAGDPCSNSDLYHLPEDFQPYTKSHHQEEGFPGPQKEHFQRFIPSEVTNSQPTESIQVKYHPYQINAAQKDLTSQDPARCGDKFDDLQREFLDTGESSTSNMQYVQLQVLYKARGRQLQELNEKLEESHQQMRFLNHQLAIVKDEKDGLAISMKESQALLQNSKEIEIQLKGQMTALEKTVEGLTSNEEQLRKELKVAKVAMESMQQQVMDMCRSDSIQRAREQHEAVVSVLTKKHEEQVFVLQQKMDAVNAALQEQKEECCRLQNLVAQAERKQEESKVDKTEIINRLTRSLEECQKQCADLLQTGSIQEATQLRMQLQQVQSSKIISDGMNKALQDEINELKEQITMYESAANLGVFTSPSEQELSDSYADLGIKKVNWRKSQLHRAIHGNGVRKDFSTDDIINELKSELERCLTSNRTKRQQIILLQSELKVSHSKTEEMKKSLEKAERNARDCEIRTGSLERQLDPAFPYSQASNEALKEEIQKLQKERQLLQQDIEKYVLCIQEYKANEEKIKTANQELCSEMRGMIQDFDKDKKEAIERCERTYEQHHEDIRKHLQMEISERFTSEKEQLCQSYEENLLRLHSQIDEMTREMTAIQECYIAVCKEKDSVEDTIRESMKAELNIEEEKITECAIRDVEKEWQHKLDQALKDAKSKVMQKVVENSVQTEQTPSTKNVLELEVKLQEALEDKDRAVREARRELESQYHEDISKQVELALTKARTRWLQELTTLTEYKTNLKLEQEKWEQLHELQVKKQILEAVAAAEENWRTKAEKDDFSLKQKEYEEKLALTQKDLEQKNEEYQALLKAELAKARTQWNKEKQEEMQNVQARNEDDYRAFLDSHRTKINEVLSGAKADFENQKAELIAQKEAEMKEQLNQSLKQWAAETSQRLHDHENKILSETELILAEIHDEMLDKRLEKGRLSGLNSSDFPFVDKLRSCLQRAIKGIFYKVLTNAKQEWNQKLDAAQTNHDLSVQSSEQERSSIPYSGMHKTTKKNHLDYSSNGIFIFISCLRCT
ncbi:centrosomal of 152 kDa isoform X2 [Pelobates cultripes]|uniref:Centrosomal of 152 kDa isoform X2 n=1 Tax=Pelobates cultripes TaxID=61616 RepID=A0AAD1VWD5_PELCU|nr:centrosomal of 152 kDa isoform X2 [Pelobates cultripes]